MSGIDREFAKAGGVAGSMAAGLTCSNFSGHFSEVCRMLLTWVQGLLPAQKIHPGRGEPCWEQGSSRVRW